ncbi:hypothetical protein [Apibacter mensalis]|uniref:hypothetical protein n=1 Tax=Apibacter mensalis TaxID=1586267 RepID=UPI0006E3C109|nr:hypothetical protein [Apibacter mensalis]
MRPIHFTEFSKNYSLCIKNGRAANPVCVENLLPLKLKKKKQMYEHNEFFIFLTFLILRYQSKE